MDSYDSNGQQQQHQHRLHVLMFPWLAHGHISSYAELSKRLLHKGVNISFFSTPQNIAKVEKDAVFAHENPDSPGKGKIQLLQLPFPSMEGLPPGIENTGDLPMHLTLFFNKAADGLEAPFEHLLRQIRPDCVVFDFVQWWAGRSAAKLGIPSVCFATFGAAFTSFGMNPAWREYGDDMTAEDMVRPLPSYPSPAVSLKPYEAKRALPFHKGMDPDTLGFKGRCVRAIEASSAIAVKACDEIEGSFIRYFGEATGKPVLPLGPLLPDSCPVGQGKSDYVEWLETQAPGSVVYVSFGSQCFLSKEEIEEMAAGLEASGCPFLWALNAKMYENQHGRVKDWLPAGFEERIGNRGVVAGEWVPQREILSHRSTGGFVSHCGWNSVMEAMSAGIPLIASPMQFDQPHNGRLVVEELKAGVEIGRGEDGSFKREEVCRAIRTVMGKDEERGDLGRVVRSNARAIGEVFQQKILKEGGSQDWYLLQFVEHLSQLKAEAKGKDNGSTGKCE